MNSTDESTLAWALADSASTFLSPSDHAGLCAKIGAGEVGSAVADLLVFYARSRAGLPFDLAASVRRWIDGYAGSDNEPLLRTIYERICVSKRAAGISGPAVGANNSPRRLVATRARPSVGALAVKQRAAAPNPMGARSKPASVELLVDAAVEARRALRAATEAAVREARLVNWSWDQIAAALGGESTGDSLRREYGVAAYD